MISARSLSKPGLDSASHEASGLKPQSPMQKPSSKLEKYSVVKMLGSGDYLCNDQLGNQYLLVCQFNKSGLSRFKASLSHNFRRNNSNRALLTPLEDIEHDGAVFTVYMLAEKSAWLGDLSPLKFRSQIFCLSLLYALINKVIKPLHEMFGANAQKWLHVENIWVRDSNVFYVINDRTREKETLQTSNKKSIISEVQLQDANLQDLQQAFQKRLLKKMCGFLIVYFKPDPELRSFQSIIMDAILNEELTIDQSLFLLNDRRKRKQFIKQRNQESRKDENLNQFRTPNADVDFWKKKTLNVESTRRGLKNYTINWQNKNAAGTEFQNLTIRKRSETIFIPEVYKTKRYSSPNTRLFDFKARKLNKSLKIDYKSDSPTKNAPKIGNLIGKIHEKIENRSYKSRYLRFHSSSLTIQNEAYNRFKQKFLNQTGANIATQTIDQQDKQLKQYLETKSTSKNKRSITIDVGDLREKKHERSSNRYTNVQNVENHNARHINNTFKSKNILEQFHNRAKQQPLTHDPIQSPVNRPASANQKEKAAQSHDNFLPKLSRPHQSMQEKQQSIKQKPDTPKANKIEEVFQKVAAPRQSQKLKEFENDEKNIQKNESVRQIKKFPMNQTQDVDFDKIEIVKPHVQSTNDQKQKQANAQSLPKIAIPPLPINKIKQSKDQRVAEPKVSSKKQKNQDQIQQINLGLKKRSSQEQVVKKQPPGKLVEVRKSLDEKKQEKKQKIPNEDNRVRTLGSEIASSCGPQKSVAKQISEYMHMINKIGETVAKSSRVAPKLEGIEWFTGIYFLYKRFLFERKRIEKALAKNQPILTRYQQKNKEEWQQWFSTQEKKSLQQKVKTENENIVSSILKMNKKLLKKKLPSNFMFHADLNRHSEDESKIVVSQIVREYDEVLDATKLEDEEILGHVNELMNSLYIIAELDGKIKQRKPLVEVLKKRNVDELDEFADFFYELYFKPQQSKQANLR